MKVLFLDHDGVICLLKQWGKRLTAKAKRRGDIFDPFCKKAVVVLNRIIQETDCTIVCSSTWRESCDIEYMQSMFEERGVLKSPEYYTPIMDMSEKDFIEVDDASRKSWFNLQSRSEIVQAVCRNKEVVAWIKDFGEDNITSWVAVDDLPMFELGENFVHTPLDTEGIKQCGIADKIIKILNNTKENE